MIGWRLRSYHQSGAASPSWTPGWSPVFSSPMEGIHWYGEHRRLGTSRVQSEDLTSLILLQQLFNWRSFLLKLTWKPGFY